MRFRLTAVPLPTEDPRAIDVTVMVDIDSIFDAMYFLRRACCSLGDILVVLAECLDHLESSELETEHGSCQDIRIRWAAQLVGYYGVSVEAFYHWDT